jgi:hypothetical protein
VFKRSRERQAAAVNELPEPLLSAGNALRLQVLRAATIYGLTMVVGTDDVEQVDAWKSWLRWLRSVSPDASDRQALGLSSDLLPSAVLVDAVMASPKRQAPTETEPLSDAFRANWLDLLERLEEFGRMVQRYGVAPLGENTLDRVGVDLLGVLEDALILLTYGDDEDQRSLPSSSEIYELLRTARSDRTFARWDPTPALQLQVLRVAPQIPPQTDDDWLAVLDCLQQASATADLYVRLHVGGGRLEGEQRTEVQNRLRAGALSTYPLMRFRQETEIPTDTGQPLTIRAMLWRLRSIHRSLVLTLSDQPDRRSLVMSVEELRDPSIAGKRYRREHPT